MLPYAHEEVAQYLEQWQRSEDRRKLRQQRQDKARARSAATAAWIEHRRLQVEREARWKWMHRPDITMADLLSSGSQ